MADDVETGRDSDRRSSVRVRSLLPCGLRPIEDEEIEELEARILDLAVIESDGMIHEMPDWSERTDELKRDVVFVLNEIRALRQQITELQRKVELQTKSGLEARWVILNDRGLFLPVQDDDPEWTSGDHCEVRLQIPSIQIPEILAVGEIIRVDETDDDNDEDGPGAAIVFRYISQSHSKAIIRYALRRERQLARSVRFH